MGGCVGMCLDVKRHKNGWKEKCISGINERMWG